MTSSMSQRILRVRSLVLGPTAIHLPLPGIHPPSWGPRTLPQGDARLKLGAECPPISVSKQIRL